MKNIQELIGREIAAAMNEMRGEIESALNQYFESVDEKPEFVVTNLNDTQVLIDGGVTEQAAAYLRGAGFEVIHSGDMAVARTKAKKKLNSKRGGPAAGKIGELKFFNDTKSLNFARKAFQEIVEAKDWRNFPMFLKHLDNVIVDARVLEGNPVDDDTDPADKAPMIQNDGSVVMAGIEGDTGNPGVPGNFDEADSEGAVK